MSRYSLTSECGAAGVQRITETEVTNIPGEKVTCISAEGNVLSYILTPVW